MIKVISKKKTHRKKLDYFGFCEAGSHISQASLELTMYPRMTLNSRYLCLNCLSTMIRSICYHSWQRKWTLEIF